MSALEHYTFIPDRHTRADLLEAALADAVGTPVLLGDGVDGPYDEPATLRLEQAVVEAGGYAIVGNHEVDRIRVVNAAHHWRNDTANRLVCQEIMSGWLQAATCGGWALEAYGIKRYQDDSGTILELQERMEAAGGLFSFLCRLTPYFNPYKSNFLGIHAGLTTDPWVDQKRQLDSFHQELVSGGLPAVPPQLNNHRLAMQAEPFRPATRKTVVTGHSSLSGKRRITGDGKRVRLSNNVKNLNHTSILTYNTIDRSIQVIHTGR